MPKPSKRIRAIGALLAAAVLAAALSASCVESAPAGPLAVLVPAEAIAAVVVESPYKLYAATEEFWKSAGLDKSVGLDLQGLLSKSVPGAALALQTLDFARPWALAVLPAAGPKKTRQVLYLPYRTAPDELVATMFGSGSLKLVAKASGYIALSDAEGELAFPPAKGADLSRLSRYPVSSVKLWGDPQAIRCATSDSYTPIHEAIRAFMTPPAQAGGVAGLDLKSSTKAMGELGLAILAQMGLADAALEPSAAGLVIRLGAAAKGGSDAQKALAAASFSPSALDWASQASSEALYGYAWSMDPGLASGLYQKMMEPLFSTLGLPKDIAARAASLQSRWAKAAGPRGAMSLDMDIDATALADAKNLGEDPAAVAQLFKKLLKIRYDLVQEVKAEAGYRALLAGLPADPDFLAFSKAYGQAFGLSLGLSNKDRKDGAFAYGELGLDLAISDPAKLGLGSGAGGSSTSKAAAEAALAAIGNMASMRWTVANGRFFATSGDAAALKSLAARKAAVKSLGADPGFAAFAKSMPAKTLMVGSLSMRKLMAMVSGIVTAAGAGGGSSAGGTSPVPDPALFGSWYSYLALDARGLAPGIEFGLLVPASDLGALVQSGGALFKSLGSGKGI